VADLRVAVRVRPGASRTRVGGEHGDALVVAVQAPAVDGRATEAALRALADALGTRRRQVRLVSGATRRDKVVEIDTGSDGVEAVAARVAELRGGAR
jgi:uncharacterized protein